MKEFLAKKNLLRELIQKDAAEAIRFQKDNIQSLITKNLGTKESCSLIGAIATNTCNSFAASWDNSNNDGYNGKYKNGDEKSEKFY